MTKTRQKRSQARPCSSNDGRPAAGSGSLCEACRAGDVPTPTPGLHTDTYLLRCASELLRRYAEPAVAEVVAGLTRRRS